ncbi:MAG: nucleoside deaminase [Verrucomicrobiales bacterium]|jgi:tRNA(Arg) A34 adenosine deaminase TadA
MNPRFPAVVLQLPYWLESELPPVDHIFATPDDRMTLVLRLATLNIKHQTGGPFAAAVFDLESGTLVAPGVNIVVSSHASIAHAEMVAVSMAQRIQLTHDLGSIGKSGTQLVTSVAPCAMCLGAVPWSGVRSLICGARGEDANAIGFDEGSKPTDWVAQLEARGITVQNDLMRAAAADVLNHYKESGGAIYNGRSPR